MPKKLGKIVKTMRSQATHGPKRLVGGQTAYQPRRHPVVTVKGSKKGPKLNPHPPR